LLQPANSGADTTKNYGNGGRNPIGCKLRVSTTLNHRRLSVVEAGMYGFSTKNEPETDDSECQELRVSTTLNHRVKLIASQVEGFDYAQPP